MVAVGGGGFALTESVAGAVGTGGGVKKFQDTTLYDRSSSCRCELTGQT